MLNFSARPLAGPDAKRVLGAAELVLLLLLAVQAALFFWALMRPLGPLGDWRAPLPATGEAGARFAALDPLFGVSVSGGQLVVSDLDLEVTGLRMDRATGRGSAILGGEDMPQRSYDVGEEIMPGVVLESVAADHVVLSRGGRSESLFIDQSQPVRSAAPAVRTDLPVRTASQSGNAVQDLARELRMTPRLGGGDGLSVMPGGTGRLFRESGLRPGDVVLSINGQDVNETRAAASALARLRPGATVNLLVARRGETVPISIKVPRS